MGLKNWTEIYNVSIIILKYNIKIRKEKIMETKQCSKCKRELTIDNFRWRNKAQGKLHSQCKDCEKERDKIHYLESKARREAVKTTANSQKENNLNIVEQYKECGCQKCGENRKYLLEFHHIDPKTKVNTIAHMIKSSSQDSLLKEIKKCVILCANCHREFHYLEKINNLTIREYLPG